MDATNITGAPAGDAVFSLLSVLSDPAQVQARLDALNAATAENKKYVEAIGPASEILKMRDDAAQALADANSYLSAAKSKAIEIVNEANNQSAEILKKARADANELKAQAEVTLRDAKVSVGMANDLAARVSSDMKTITADREALDKLLADATASKDAADLERQAYEGERQALIAKHEQFIAGL